MFLCILLLFILFILSFLANMFIFRHSLRKMMISRPSNLEALMENPATQAQIQNLQGICRIAPGTSVADTLEAVARIRSSLFKDISRIDGVNTIIRSEFYKHAVDPRGAVKELKRKMQDFEMLPQEKRIDKFWERNPNFLSRVQSQEINGQQPRGTPGQPQPQRVGQPRQAAAWQQPRPQDFHISRTSSVVPSNLAEVSVSNDRQAYFTHSFQGSSQDGFAVPLNQVGCAVKRQALDPALNALPPIRGRISPEVITLGDSPAKQQLGHEAVTNWNLSQMPQNHIVFRRPVVVQQPAPPAQLPPAYIRVLQERNRQGVLQQAAGGPISPNPRFAVRGPAPNYPDGSQHFRQYRVVQQADHRFSVRGQPANVLPPEEEPPIKYKARTIRLPQPRQVIVQGSRSPVPPPPAVAPSKEDDLDFADLDPEELAKSFFT